MIKALIDPSIFVPPTGGPCLPWLSHLKRWSQALREFDTDTVTPVMSEAARAGFIALGGRAAIQSALDSEGSPMAASDVLRLIDRIQGGAVVPSEVFEPSEVAFNRLSVAPEYVDSGQSDVIESFRQDLGHGAAFQKETSIRVIAITSDFAWAKPSDQVAISAEVEAWERFGAIEEPDSDEAGLVEEIDLWSTPRAADKTFRSCWNDLIKHPKLGIEVAYRGFTDEAAEVERPLMFEVGSQLVSTMNSMGYMGQAGRIRRVFYAAAHVACQRGGDLSSLAPHPYRTSKAARSKPVERADGARLMRGSLGTGANANRLMWWDGPVPVILGVVGHNDDPRFLTR